MSDENQPDEVIESQLKSEAAAPKLAPVPVPEVAEVAEAAPSAVVPSEIMPPEPPFEAETYDAVPVSDTPDTAPSIVSIAELEAAKPSMAEKLGMFLTGVGTFFRGRRWLLGGLALLILLVIVVLLMPELSLAQLGSAFESGYTTLDATNSTVEHPDGLKVKLSAPVERKVRVKLDSVPQADFVAGSASDLRPALNVLPAYLTPKSPYYKITLRGKDVSGPAQLEVVIPNEAEPWETLDLYSWDGDTWRWLPTRLDRNAEVLTADVKTLPASVMVMQTGLAQPKIATEVGAFPLPTTLTPSPEAALTEVNVPGILIGTMGGVTGDATQLPAAAQGGALTLVPIVRNWVPGRDPNWALVSDMLNNANDRVSHVQNLLGVAQSGGYSGLVLDYRRLPAEDRDVYAGFVTDLAKTFHQNGLWLAVVVETPQRAADGTWDSGGYDWAALGEAADQLRVVMPLDPGAYAPGGFVEQMLTWAVTQVHRHKLMPVYTTLSTDGEKVVGLDAILAPIGSIQPATPLTDSVAPGTALLFKLGAISNVETDALTGATRLVIGETSQWLGTPQWLRTRLDLVSRYHLGGVVLRDLTDAGNLPGILDVVAAYKAQTTTAAFALPEIAWGVTGPDGKAAAQQTTPLTQPQFAWTAPTMTGTYKIAANVAGLDKGTLEVRVALPAPVVTATVAETTTTGSDTGATTATPTPQETPGEELKAGFVADVTVPDNTRFQKGEKFTKTWRMRNAGNTDWPKDTALVFVSGEKMTDVAKVEIGEVKAGANVDISVEMTAPNADGTYRGDWQIQVGDKAISGGKVYLIIQVGEQPAATPVTPIVAPVSSGGFELGGHVRDLGLPYKEKMHYAGMNWVKIQVHYGQGANSIINTAHANGFKIQLSALGGPEMVTQAGFEDKFASWVAGLASAGADAIEVWNEPNIDREWQIGLISPQAYTNLLCKAYNAIKAANGGTAVISAAPAPTGWFGGCGPNGCDDKPWMEGLYNAGAANCMDYIGAHHNSGATSPSARIGHPANPSDTHHSWFFLPQTELYYNIFRGTRKLFYTEMGYASQEGVPTFSDQFAWARGTNNAQQAAWLAEAVQLGINTGMVRCIIVWNIDFVRYGYDPQDGYAIIRPDGSCPACESLHAVLGTR
ncbi:MAG TPA: NBR1-Ig-like domain-containing protein [Anaerolineae bacterium]|nr:NBR1-Ig-like domain-containing protein [Anaerolineae bacterium]HQK13710.1 NBR1-Ig-like domain-containing protein [Anaerolineae bacterium]